jgi:phage-related protein
MKKDILSFEILLYSTNGVTSPVIEYLLKLYKKNPELFKKALKELYTLPQHFYLGTNVKAIKHKSKTFYELRVKQKNNICRFFFTIEKPNFIIVHGFTKKSQKIEKKDLEKGFDHLQSYEQTQQTIKLKDVGDLT